MARLSDKWSMLVILALGGFGTMRFNELKHKIGDVSQRMLTVTLRNLENDGLLTRTIYPEIPPRVEYALTPLGHSFKEQIAGFANWATAHTEEIYRKRFSDS
ncbi:MAG: helix-turn-helix transcriptional regulator [Bacteroidia bacterium]|nr:helix-turn-helix transcriptional regulator [Bacteroidia bacterium]